MTANRMTWLACLFCVGVAVAAAQDVAPAPRMSLFSGLSTKPVTEPKPTGGIVPVGGQAPGLPFGSVSSVDSLTTPMNLPNVPSVPGTVYSPWCGDSRAGAGNCAGPVGGNGVVTYEGYIRNGPSLVAGGGELSAILKTGWTVQGGARTLFFNQPGDAAWVLDLGLGYTRNKGQRLDRTTQAFVVGTPVPQTGAATPDTLDEVGIRGLSRSSFNFALGRDYFLNGPGVVGHDSFGNIRVGWDVGGRWGTTSIDLEPALEPGGYRRRQDVYHGLFLGTQLNWEKPLGGWTFLVGARLEWSYYWMNILPPQQGNFRDINIMMMFGVRF
jgi:hypothetical protein